MDKIIIGIATAIGILFVIFVIWEALPKKADKLQNNEVHK